MKLVKIIPIFNDTDHLNFEKKSVYIKKLQGIKARFVNRMQKNSSIAHPPLQRRDGAKIGVTQKLGTAKVRTNGFSKPWLVAHEPNGSNKRSPFLGFTNQMYINPKAWVRVG